MYSYKFYKNVMLEKEPFYILSTKQGNMYKLHKNAILHK